MGHADAQHIPPRRRWDSSFLGIGSALRATRARPGVSSQRRPRPALEYARSDARGARRVSSEVELRLMITLYGFGRVHRQVIGETRDLRAQWALEEVGLPYRVHGLDHTGDELDGAAYKRINCFRLVPVIDDDGFVVAESGAVLLYIAEKAGKLIPPDFQGRMRVIQWCFAALTTIERPLMEIYYRHLRAHDTH